MNKNNRFRVYIHRLREDGRVYVGQTSSTLKERSGSNGHRYKNCPKFFNAIQKYGWDAFDHIVIKDNLTLEEANILEAELIEYYDSINNGFNLIPGGRNHTWTKEQRKQMSERTKGSKNPNYGKPMSEDRKRKIGEANKISQLGHRHSKETKEKMSKAHRQYIPILCVETNVIYSCPSEAGAFVGHRKNPGHITEVCEGKRKTAYGYHWKYIEKRKEG